MKQNKSIMLLTLKIHTCVTCERTIEIHVCETLTTYTFTYRTSLNFSSSFSLNE